MLLNRTKKLALGSILTAFGVIIMLMTGVFPFAEYALPGIAGALMIILVTELGKGYSFLSFLAVAILSFILVPLKDSAVFYAVFLGWYPIMKSKLESVKSRTVQWVLKVLIFNIALVLGVFASVYIFGIKEYLEILSYAIWLIGALWVFVNVVFAVYDIALTRWATIYIHILRRKIFKNY